MGERAGGGDEEESCVAPASLSSFKCHHPTRPHTVPKRNMPAQPLSLSFSLHAHSLRLRLTLAEPRKRERRNDAKRRPNKGNKHEVEKWQGEAEQREERNESSEAANRPESRVKSRSGRRALENITGTRKLLRLEIST